MMQRRLFMQALASSVVAAGASLPIGFPKDMRGVEHYDTDLFYIKDVSEVIRINGGLLCKIKS